ncbi:MAG: hypothetical protein HYY63_04885, partial [Elusimicrobia bacterium]|nr:hypothetical protein [Elusimicrobiota bacterium]
MAVIFFYVQVGFAALEPASKFWQERKAAAERMKNGESESKEKENRPAKVAAPQSENALLAQLPSLELNVLTNSVPKIQDFGASSLAATMGSGEKKIPAADLTRVLPSWFRSVSMSYVSLKDLYIPSNWKANDLMVIHIQDAHENFEAQKNISRVIESLAQGEKKQIGETVETTKTTNTTETTSTPNSEPSKSLMLVGVEGAKGPFDFVPYRTFPDQEIARGVSEYMLKESFISGPEYVGMTLGVDPESDKPASEEPPILFWGIEDENLYMDHVQAFKDSVPIEREAKEYLKNLTVSVGDMKSKIFNSELRDLDSKIMQYHQGTIRLGLYLKILTKDGIPAGQEMIRNFMNALNLEETLNYDNVEKERKELTNTLVEKVSKQELKNLVSASLSYRLGNISYGAFYRYLMDVCSAYGVSIQKWPEMDKYIRYVLISDKIRSEELFAELEQLEKRRIKSLVLTPQEKSLMELSQDMMLLEKLIGYRLSPTDWEDYQTKRETIRAIPQRAQNLRLIAEKPALGMVAPEIVVDPALGDRSGGQPKTVNIAELGGGEKVVSNLDRLLKPFERFNSAAISRNDVLVNNLLKKFQTISSGSQNTRIAVLVAGGFHTAGMTEILKQKNVAYAVLTPRLGKVEGKGTDYLDIFRRDKTPLE